MAHPTTPRIWQIGKSIPCQTPDHLAPQIAPNRKNPSVSAALRPHQSSKYGTWARHDAWLAASKRKGKDAPAPGPEPTIRRKVVDDITLESQLRIHAANPRGVVRAPDELVAMLESFGAYKRSGGGDRGAFLRLFDGDGITVDRVGGGTIRAESALMGLLAGTQPDVIARLTTDLGGDGMLQRFLFIVHDGVDRRGVDEEPDHAALGEYARAIRGLAAAEYLFPQPIRLSAGAHRVLAATGEAIAKLKHLPGAPAAWPGHVEKWGKILPRIVLTFHALESWALLEEVRPDDEIAESTAEMAVRFSGFLLQHSWRFYQTYFDATAAASEARWIAGYLLTKPETQAVTPRDIYHARAAFKGQSGRRPLLAAMSELEGLGWSRVANRDADGPTAWTINPKIHRRFTAHAEREVEERAAKRAKLKEAGEAKRGLFAHAARDNSEEDSQND
ncbi:MAG: DUF3987 domain-containing protein [Bifidobacterium asteroides]